MAEIEEANERLRSVLASVSDCYFTLDRAYHISDLNEAARGWVEPDPDRALGACPWDLCDPRAECSLVIRESMEARRSLQDEERQRIAGELHDSTAQHLAGLVLHLMRLRPFVMPEGHKVLDEAADSAEEAARELRAFTYLLHPAGLEHGGLAGTGTVRAFAAGFARRCPVRIRSRTIRP